MNQQTAPGQDDDEIQDLAMLVAKNLADGESPDTIVNQLVDSGWETDDANSFVASIQHQLAQMQSHQGDGGNGLVALDRRNSSHKPAELSV